MIAPSCRKALWRRRKRLVPEGMAKRGWTETDLARRRKGDREKLALGLRSQTTMTLAYACQT
jgi:hypothetical protein